MSARVHASHHEHLVADLAEVLWDDPELLPHALDVREVLAQAVLPPVRPAAVSSLARRRVELGIGVEQGQQALDVAVREGVEGPANDLEGLLFGHGSLTRAGKYP